MTSEKETLEAQLRIVWDEPISEPRPQGSGVVRDDRSLAVAVGLVSALPVRLKREGWSDRNRGAGGVTHQLHLFTTQDDA